MGTCGFSVPRQGLLRRPRQGRRPGATAGAVAPGRRRRGAAPAAWLLVLALTVAAAGCAALGAALRSSVALQAAGFQNANVNVSNGSGLPAGGLVTVTYTSGPTGNDQQDAQRAEKIVWNNYSDRFGGLDIVKESGGCAGPVCVTHSTELASVTYAQLAASFGPRPAGADKPGPALPSWAVPVGAFAGLAGLVAIAVIAVVLIVRRKKSRAGGPPPWQSGPWPPVQQAGWPTGSPPQVP